MNLPIEFEKATKSLLDSSYEAFKSSLENLSPTSIRINQSKFNVLDTSLQQIAWSKSGFYLDERPMFTADPLFHAGVYYVQEASSMMIEQVISYLFSDSKSYKVLDLCASPGGKTTHLIDLFSTSSLIVANETIKSRTSALIENLTKWGTHNTIVTNNDSADYTRLPSFFDFVLVDAPCSGEGMFRKQQDSIKHWSPDNVQLCASRQKRIIANAWETLKPGGYLLYSTCTYNQQENEDVLSWLQQKESIRPISLPDQYKYGVMTNENHGIQTYRCYPHRMKGEGFTFSIIQKPITETSSRNSTKRLRSSLKINKTKDILPSISRSFHDDIFQTEYGTYIFPNQYLGELSLIQENLRVLKWGVKYADLTSKKIIPNHEFVISTCIDKDFYPVIDLEYEDVIQFLRGEAITSPSLVLGWHMIQFNGHILGLCKNIGNRLNNKYPKNLRILTTVDKLVSRRFSIHSFLTISNQ